MPESANCQTHPGERARDRHIGQKITSEKVKFHN